MADFPALPLWTDAYLSDTRHLTTEQNGAYLLLLMEAWRRKDCALPDDDHLLAKLAGLGVRRWKSMKPVIMEFWSQSDGYWTQSRLSKERKFVNHRSTRQRDLANRRWLKNKEKDDATAYATQHAPTPTPTVIETQNPSTTQNLNHTSTVGNGSAPPVGGYRFEGKIIRLNDEHYETWKKRFHAIPDFDCQLGVLDDWYDRNLELGERKKWFNRACSALAKKHQEIVADRVPPSTGYTPSKGLLG